MHFSTIQKEKWALVGLLHPYISTPSTVTHIFNHHTPTPELSPTPSTSIPQPSHPHRHTLTITPSPSHPQPSYPHHHTLTSHPHLRILTSHPHHHTLTHPYTLYLIVESFDPVIMTLSSYCRHSTISVWPTSSVVTLRDLRSQICSEGRVSCHNSYQWLQLASQLHNAMAVWCYLGNS